MLHEEVPRPVHRTHSHLPLLWMYSMPAHNLEILWTNLWTNLRSTNFDLAGSKTANFAKIDLSTEPLGQAPWPLK